MMLYKVDSVRMLVLRWREVAGGNSTRDVRSCT